MLQEDTVDGGLFPGEVSSSIHCRTVCLLSKPINRLLLSILAVPALVESLEWEE